MGRRSFEIQARHGRMPEANRPPKGRKKKRPWLKAFGSYIVGGKEEEISSHLRIALQWEKRRNGA